MILYKSPSQGRSAWPLFCLPLLSFSPFLSFLFIGSARVYLSSRCLPSSFSSLQFDPRFSRRVLFSRSPLLLREARDRHLHRWQRDSFVLSRRFQLIFIVYLPDRRYLEDNGPPLYIRAPANLTAKAYLLSSCVSVWRGWFLSSVSAFDLSETDCVNRHCWILLISIF